MPIVTVDRKGRIQLPSELRRQWRLKPREPLLVRISRDSACVTKVPKATPETDPLLRDLLLRPLRAKKALTREELEKAKDEMWLP